MKFVADEVVVRKEAGKEETIFGPSNAIIRDLRFRCFQINQRSSTLPEEVVSKTVEKCVAKASANQWTHSLLRPPAIFI